ncbi:MAG: ATP-binding protein [Dolichospermum sp. LBC05a]|jgi:AAA15 family ATPase/GTPase|nr:ATP-binding protein [Dolichospermum sp. OL01]MCO5798005.1 ATP-binding protein [Dolichospermum sp. OL03]MCS6281671.1 ATP-binding protein [Dolichospermum sp.]QSV59484.1 MAG: ATP-binding protein [Dolichospermum sp. LBC05a]
MRLDFVEYCQDKDLPSEWRLDGCQLGNVNLIVGKNASGKSRTLRAINLLSGLLSGDASLRPDRRRREWRLTFDSHNEDNKKIYVLTVDKGQVIQESFTIGSTNYLQRNESGEGQVWAKKLDQYIDFQTPIDEVAALKRRDSIQHPFFEEIYTWANSLRYYKFGTDLGKSSFIVLNTKKIDAIRKNIDFKDADQVIGIFKLGEEEIGTPFIEAIKSDMLSVGYKISEVGTKTPSALLSDEGDEVSLLDGEPQYIYVQESDLREKTEQGLMSQGMFRVLSLIIQVNYSLLAKQPSCILIDDIGEGLDFERSSAMIELLIKKAETGLVQLIMTTNDSFVMNGVPLDYWSVIERKPGLAKLHNIHNSKPIFDDFKFIGLNNFDFFETQFYLKGFDNEEHIEE